jgi:hypothetical protein
MISDFAGVGTVRTGHEIDISCWARQYLEDSAGGRDAHMDKLIEWRGPSVLRRLRAGLALNSA